MIDKEISQYSLDGRYVRTYRSVGEASRKTGLTKSNISSAARGSKTTTGAYFWRFTSPQERKDNIESLQRIPKVRRRVTQYTLDGTFVKTFLNCGDAGDKTGINRSCIWACASGQRWTSGGYLWKFTDNRSDLEEVTACQCCGKKIGLEEKITISFDCLQRLKGVEEKGDEVRYGLSQM